ncbi:IS5 family transposase, partial [Vibrio splendidus]
PRKNVACWEDGHPRNEAVEALKNGTIAEWKSESGYHYRSISETAMSRYKGLTSGKLSLRCYNVQVGEIMANVKAINKVIGLGMPVRS